MPTAWIPLTLSWYPSLSAITLDNSSSSVVFKLWTEDHKGSATWSAGVHKYYMEFLKFYIITLAVELQIPISNNKYTPMKIKFKQQPHPKFYLSIVSEYPLLPQKAVKLLLPFATTYLCKRPFSALTCMVTKYRSRLVVQNELGVSLPKISPRIDNLCQAKHTHPSH